MLNNITSKRIRELREEKGITQLELANRLFVTQQTIALWETGKRDLKSEMIISLAKIFDVTADYLLGLSEYKDHASEDIGRATGLTEENITLINKLHNNTFWEFDAFSKNLCGVLNDLMLAFIKETYRTKYRDKETLVETIWRLYVNSEDRQNIYKEYRANYISEQDSLSLFIQTSSDTQMIENERQYCLSQFSKILDDIIDYNGYRSEYREMRMKLFSNDFNEAINRATTLDTLKKHKTEADKWQQ